MIIYISGPYTAPTEKKIKANISKARYCAIRIMQLGHTVICPHTMTAFWDKVSNLTYDDFMKMYLDLIKVADALFMLPGWRESEGATQEYREAIRLGKEFFYTFSELESRECANKENG